MRILNMFCTSAIGIAIVACGGAPKPDARLVSSQAAIRGATEIGANDVPRAALHLKLAEEQRQRAVALVNNDDNQRAEYMLMRAEADADLAVALAREAAAKDEADKMQDQINELKRKAKQ